MPHDLESPSALQHMALQIKINDFFLKVWNKVTVMHCLAWWVLLSNGSSNYLPKNTVHRIFHICHAYHFEAWSNRTDHSIFSVPSQSIPRNNPGFLLNCVHFWVCRKPCRFHPPTLSLADLSSCWEHIFLALVQFRHCRSRMNLQKIFSSFVKYNNPSRTGDDINVHSQPCNRQTLLMMVVITYAHTATTAMIIGNFKDMLWDILLCH